MRRTRSRIDADRGGEAGVGSARTSGSHAPRLPRGRSSHEIRPCSRQPTAASQVRARATGVGPAGVVTGSRHPPNHRADEQGSSPRSPAQCFRRAVTHRPWRRERPGMVSLVPHPPPAAEGAIDRAGHTDGEPPEPAAQRAPVVGLDNQMQMVILNAEVQNPKASVGGDGKRAADGGEGPRRTQAPDCGSATEGNMHGVCGDVHRPRAVCDAGAAVRRALPTSTGATAAPCAWLRKRELQSPRHLEKAIIAW